MAITPAGPITPATTVLTWDIVVPGLDEIIKLPIDLDDDTEDELKRKRVGRLLASKRTTPDWVERTVAIINHLDDAEDLISTMLILARPILRRAIPRLIPGLGWVLLAGDVLDVINFFLSAAVGTPTSKRGAELGTKPRFKGKRGRMNRVDAFFNKKIGFGAFLEAGQTLNLLTGYGLVLGGIMGAVNNLVWATLGAAQGDRTRIRWGENLTLVERATKVALQIPDMVQAWEVLTPREVMTTIGGGIVALEILIEENLNDAWNDTVNDFANWFKPSITTTNPRLRKALDANGIDPDTPGRPVTASGEKEPGFMEVVRDGIVRREEIAAELAAKPENAHLLQVQQMLYNQLGTTAIENIMTPVAEMQQDPTEEEKNILRMAEANQWIMEEMTPEQHAAIAKQRVDMEALNLGLQRSTIAKISNIDVMGYSASRLSFPGQTDETIEISVRHKNAGARAPRGGKIWSLGTWVRANTSLVHITGRADRDAFSDLPLPVEEDPDPCYFRTVGNIPIGQPRFGVLRPEGKYTGTPFESITAEVIRECAEWKDFSEGFGTARDGGF